MVAKDVNAAPSVYVDAVQKSYVFNKTVTFVPVSQSDAEVGTVVLNITPILG